MKTISIDNKHYIPARVAMLPTEIGIIGKQIHTGHFALPDEFGYKEFYKGGNVEPQHLYLVCDLPIELKDWVLDKNKSLYKQETDKIFEHFNNPKKVIATTDSSLKYGEDIPTIIRYKSLPQFPQPFIKEFVERQGKDVDVLVEVEKYTETTYAMGIDCNVELCKIKLNPNNTVNIIFK